MSGKRNDRPAIAEALRLCRLHRATPVIAKLDRLARNVHFISSLMESGVEFVAVDFPQASRLTVHILVAIAEDGAKLILDRTKSALSAAKAHSVELGGQRGDLKRMPAIAAKGHKVSAAVRSAAAAKRNEELMPVIQEVQESGCNSPKQIADALNTKGYYSRPRWRLVFRSGSPDPRKCYDGNLSRSHDSEPTRNVVARKPRMFPVGNPHIAHVCILPKLSARNYAFARRVQAPPRWCRLRRSESRSCRSSPGLNLSFHGG
jgi:DNA invertase Pin-like site-specific DNA recombinase